MDPSRLGRSLDVESDILSVDWELKRPVPCVEGGVTGPSGKEGAAAEDVGDWTMS